MADIKISQLGSAITVDDSDIVPVVSGGNTLKASAAQLKEHAIGNTSISGIGDGSVTGAISALNSDKQPKTLATSITVDGTPQTTVEGALGAINTDLGSTKQALTHEVTTRSTNGAHNLLPNKATSQTDYGVTFTVNPDGSITASGTASGSPLGYAELKVNNSFVLPAGTYRKTGCPEGGSSSTYGFGGSSGNDYGSGNVFTSDGTTALTYIIFVTNGTTINKTFYPMVCLVSDEDTTYKPYAMTNRELTDEPNTLHASSISGVSYVKIGRVVTAYFRNITINGETTTGLPALKNNTVISFRDETVGGIAHIVINDVAKIMPEAGQSGYTAGHQYSGMLSYIAK